jgi:hypothetical protein
MRIITPERELKGTEFHSNETMTKYEVFNSAGAFPVSDTENNTPADSTATPPSTEAPKTTNTTRQGGGSELLKPKSQH